MIQDVDVAADGSVERIRREQIESVFGHASAGVIGALCAAFALAVTLSVVDSVYTNRAFTWAVVLAIFALGHLIFCFVFWKTAPSRRESHEYWPRLLCVFYLAEGLTWGWSSVSFVSSDKILDQLLVYVMLGGISAGSVTAIANYLPAFYAFFLPTIMPLVAQGFLVEDTLRRAAAAYAFILVGTMLVLARRVNRDFVAQLKVRFRAEDLAEELRQSREAAVQANLSKSRFLASASHDLRQPIHALGMFVGALKARRMDREARRLVDHIEGSVSAMDDLFAALLDISRLDAGIVEVDARPFAIQRLLERICRDHTAEAAAKGVRLRLQDSSAIVHSDPILLERVLRNIVSNAVRYTDHGGIVVGCRRREQLVVQVWDTGRGIPADRQNEVFDEFYQLGNTERDRTKGLGLGLAIVKRLTALLGHDLTLRSQPDRGSVFSVALPFGDRDVAMRAAQAQPLSGRHRHALILVVEDETMVLEAMRSLLTSWGHTVMAARSGEELLALVADCPTRPDLVICDYRLRNDETGIDVIERLQSEYNDDIPGILITGDTAPDRLAEARASGFLLLHKPVADAKLRAAIGNLLHAYDLQPVEDMPSDVPA